MNLTIQDIKRLGTPFKAEYQLLNTSQRSIQQQTVNSNKIK